MAEFRRNFNSFQNIHDLRFHFFLAEVFLRTIRSLALGTAVKSVKVDVAILLSFDFFLGGDRRTAFAASDHAGKREFVRRVRFVAVSQNHLCPVEFLFSNHRFMLTLVNGAAVFEFAVIKRVGKHCVEFALNNAFRLPFADQAQLFFRVFADLRNRVISG
ncbi:MAG: hypothetical protein WA103_03490 [Minisyncoccales bacterium]